jgi:Uma2 family endonuclease
MTATQQLTEEEFVQLVFASPERKLELYDGEVREKPAVSWEHGNVALELGYLLRQQLDRRQFRIAINDWRVRPAPGSIYMPDLVVVPTNYGEEFKGRPGTLAIFRDPLPLVTEIWSRSTGAYDVNTKIPEYQRRGNLEIWCIQPYEQTITVWRRQPDGSYDEVTYREGVIRPASLPGVSIDLAELFDLP